MFAYIFDELAFDDKIVFVFESCQEQAGYKSEAPIRAGLTELLQKEFIAKGPVTNVYYINPAIFYKGDRLTLLTQVTRKGVKAIKESKVQTKLSDEL